MSASPPPEITVTEIGEFISHRSCERRFKLSFDDRAEAVRVPFAERLFNVLDPVLQLEGERREREWESALSDAGLRDVIPNALRNLPPEQRRPAWADFVSGSSGLAEGESGYGREIWIEGQIGAFRVRGRIDFCIVRWVDGRPRLRLVECKASRRDRTYQRIQVAVYGILARALLNGASIGGITLTPGDIECVVARIDESTNRTQAILEIASFELAQEEADIQCLLADVGALKRIVDTPLGQLDYQLDGKCDACVFSVHCYPESARLRKVQLVGIEPSAARALERAGVSNIDQLANVDLNGLVAANIRNSPGFSYSLAALKQRAHARLSTLPGGRDADAYEVEAIPNAPSSQLPEHEAANQNLVRIYLTVHYDYVENRIGAISAHVTNSPGKAVTTWLQVDGVWGPEPGISEKIQVGQDAAGAPQFQTRPLQGRDVIHSKSSPWTGRYAEDTGSEREILQAFFQDLVDAIADVAQAPQVPVHFYVWSRSEMQRLIEACARTDSNLLGHLRELLGCRQPLEQLIFSCLDDEVHNRFATGWTGRGLSVIASLRWFGERLHWCRIVNGRPVNLDHVFTQDIFDFKTELRLLPSGDWAGERDRAGIPSKFEIRSRFHDTLSAPYWRAVWRTLPNPEDVGNQKVANAIVRYTRAAERGFFRAYLGARAHALRWVEDRIRFKNADINKPLLAINDLVQFRLGVNTTAEAAIDFLRLDQHVSVTDWIASHLVPPSYRVPSGGTLPLSNVQCTAPRRLEGTINLSGYGLEAEAFQNHCTIQQGSFVRFAPCNEDFTRGQTVAQLLRFGSTCVVESLDWENLSIVLSVIPQRDASLYRLLSFGYNDPGVLAAAHAVVDDSPSDFVKDKVEARLSAHGGHHVCDWFNPIDPQIPAIAALPAEAMALYGRLAANLRDARDRRLVDDQINAVVEGIQSRVQLLQGPPGTGKTMTTAAATLLRISARVRVGQVVLIAANTHTAVNNVLERIVMVMGSFSQEAPRLNLPAPTLTVAKVESALPGQPPNGGIAVITSDVGIRQMQGMVSGGVCILGGTTNALLKLVTKLDGSAAFGRAGGFQASMLIVDEASMMVFPEFLALATLVGRDGQVMLTGDHRQLSPIMAHDWEREDRPPVVLYQPYASAYNAVRSIAAKPGITRPTVTLSHLRFTFRLPAAIRELIARLYRRDSIELEGRPREEGSGSVGHTIWDVMWRRNGGLFLIIHDEHESTHSNGLEAEIILQTMRAAQQLAENSVAIVTPHRAQRNLLNRVLEEFVGSGRPIGVIDTVERLQGGERPNIFVSATESDPASIATRVEFILDLNRSNVAFSRAEHRLIVVVARTLLDHVPSEVEHYDATLLWKALREYCGEEIGRTEISGASVRVYTPSDAVVQTDTAEQG